MGKTLCFTGHRPKDLFGYNNRDSYVTLKNYITSDIIKMIDVGSYDTFITGGAQGIDQLAFWAVHDLINLGPARYTNLKNELVIPFKGFGNNWGTTGLFGSEQLFKMTQYANKVTVLDKYSSKSSVVAALHYRNHCMVDNSDAVYGVLNKSIDLIHTTENAGGTIECLRYALKQNKEIYIRNPFLIDAITKRYH